MPREAPHQWLDELAESGFDTDLSANGDRAWLADIFADHGPVSARDAHEALLAHQARIARASLHLVRADVTGCGLSLDVDVEPDSPSGAPPWDAAVRIGAAIVVELDPVQSLREVAEAVQAHFSDVRHLVWPLCREHGRGLHPRVADSRAHWACSAGPHTLSPVGRLTTKTGRHPARSRSAR